MELPILPIKLESYGCETCPKEKCPYFIKNVCLIFSRSLVEFQDGTVRRCGPCLMYEENFLNKPAEEEKEETEDGVF